MYKWSISPVSQGDQSPSVVTLIQWNTSRTLNRLIDPTCCESHCKESNYRIRVNKCIKIPFVSAHKLTTRIAFSSLNLSIDWCVVVLVSCFSLKVKVMFYTSCHCVFSRPGICIIPLSFCLCSLFTLPLCLLYRAFSSWFIFFVCFGISDLFCNCTKPRATALIWQWPHCVITPSFFKSFSHKPTLWMKQL